MDAHRIAQRTVAISAVMRALGGCVVATPAHPYLRRLEAPSTTQKAKAAGIQAAQQATEQLYKMVEFQVGQAVHGPTTK